MTSGLDADVRVLEELRHRIESAENAGDVDAFREVFSDDAVMMVPDFPTQNGRDACIAFLGELLPGLHEVFDRRITYTGAEVRVDNGVAFDRGEFAFTIRPRSGGETSRVTGKYLWFYVRAPDGRWRLARAIVSRDDQDVLQHDGWRARAGLLAFRLALPLAVCLGVAEVVRNWGDWGFWPFWVVDYVAVGLLAGGWLAVRRGRPAGPAWLAGAWGFTCALFYMSFFSHLAALDRPDRGPIEHTTLTAIIGVLFALTVFAFACSLAGYRASRD